MLLEHDLWFFSLTKVYIFLHFIVDYIIFCLADRIEPEADVDTLFKTSSVPWLSSEKVSSNTSHENECDSLRQQVQKYKDGNCHRCLNLLMLCTQLFANSTTVV